ncbi:hypothetical protein D3Y59_14940 [Hymenobacter oligotrophus]|uniref:Transmembrane protein n=1 Tax=Hymenobacter oligotrophus TaxID=2319843 RepID=A0A3B7R498_9BACT|nr:DUF6766 family protein [Hymenobacter oligotrophus]AYA38223.1 hypothetical protein D3Y59_14940 [Hymenobacter oligotrophus]
MTQQTPRSPLGRFLYQNGLSLTVGMLTLITLVGQTLTGHHDYNDELQQLNRPALSLSEYVTSGHWLEATFENWESEFLQMALYVLLTVKLRQKGSAESKKLDEEEEVDREPNPYDDDAPWPVKQGGAVLWLYKHSLSLAFLVLFMASFFLHAVGGSEVYNIEQQAHGQPTVDVWGYLGTARFWFESFQNWQSEFLSIVSIVVLTIWLRQYGSPESKPVDAPHSETGK